MTTRESTGVLTRTSTRAAAIGGLALALAAAGPALGQTGGSGGGGDGVGWSVNGSNLFFLSGNVSIGTSNPAYPLYVVGAPPAAIVGTTTAASSVAVGVQGQSASTLGRGVYGYATSPTGLSYGGLFRSLSNQGTGIFALADATTGLTAGIRGQAASSGGAGIWGIATAAAGETAGIRAQVISSAGSGIVALATSTTGFTNGAFGESVSTDGAGLFGLASSQTGVTYGVYGETSSGDGYGVYSVGDTAATGLKLFQIDHPLDPANRFLNHFSAEGPEPYLIYRGNAVLGPAGSAEVTLPNYFGSINIEPTYQLTPVGAPADLYIAEEIKDGRFVIAGGNPGMKVSWTVTGIRNDAFVQRHGFRAEQLKSASQRGRFLHPEHYNLPPDRAIRPRPKPVLAPTVDPALLEPVAPSTPSTTSAAPAR